MFLLLSLQIRLYWILPQFPESSAWKKSRLMLPGTSNVVHVLKRRPVCLPQLTPEYQSLHQGCGQYESLSLSLLRREKESESTFLFWKSHSGKTTVSTAPFDYCISPATLSLPGLTVDRGRIYGKVFFFLPLLVFFFSLSQRVNVLAGGSATPAAPCGLRKQQQVSDSAERRALHQPLVHSVQ